MSSLVDNRLKPDIQDGDSGAAEPTKDAVPVRLFRARPLRCAAGRCAGFTEQKPGRQRDRQTARGVTACALRKASKNDDA